MNPFVARSLQIAAGAMSLVFSLPARAGDCPTEGNHKRWIAKTSAADQAPTDITLQTLVKLERPSKVLSNSIENKPGLLPGVFHADVGGTEVSLKEGQVVRVAGWLHLVNFDVGDSDFHIQLTDSPDPCGPGGSAIVEIPLDTCASEPSQAKRWDFLGSRRFVEAHYAKVGALKSGQTRSDLSLHGAAAPLHAEVQGQLFWDSHHYPTQADPGGGRGKDGCHANTVWEIHPVTGIVELDQAGKAIRSWNTFKPQRLRKPLNVVTRRPIAG